MSADLRESLFTLPDAEAEALGDQFGTPLYVVDQDTLVNRLRWTREAADRAHSRWALTYASKANSILALLSLIHAEGYTIDCASEGELRAAMLADAPADQCNFHGNNKSISALEFAIEKGVRHIIVDNFEELEWLASRGHLHVSLLLRIAPEVNASTHSAISTGQKETKFGFSISRALDALEQCLSANLPVSGLHAHVGSQLLDANSQVAGAITISKLASEAKARLGFESKVINVGGGRGIQYVEDQVVIPVEDYFLAIENAIRPILNGAGLDPIIEHEPGRSIVGPAGCTLYRVGARKSMGDTEFVVVDGGLSDNPRPTMYQARYTARTVGKSSGLAPVTVAGSHCEVDNLFTHINLASDTVRGDLLEVLGTGAYNASMASNYNRFLRPCTVLREAPNQYRVIQRRETFEDMFTREMD
jgi:diaminopimelate decarboxylase